MSEISIGSTVWLRNEYGGEVKELAITDESPRSWCVCLHRHFHPEVKFPKSLDCNGERWTAKLGGSWSPYEGDRFRVFLDKGEVDALVEAENAEKELARWLGTNVEEIASLVRRCKDVATLRQIAALVGYEEKEQS